MILNFQEMKLEKYLQHRDTVLNRYKENEHGYDYIENLLKGIYNKELFFKIFSMDMQFHLTCVVSSLDRFKRFSTYNNSRSCSRIKLLNRNFSRYDRNPELFEKDKNLIL